MNKKSEFLRGLKLGIPIAIGYFSVSFAFGMMVVASGFSPWIALLISMTNVTSAGQFAGLQLMAVGASYVELILTTIIINIRYALMSLSLSQKVESKIKVLERMFMSTMITDEIFAVAAIEKGEVNSNFFHGLMLLPYVGWSLGTILGALISGLLPHNLQMSLSIALYGMFIAIIIPVAKKSKPVLSAIIIAGTISSIIYYTPLKNFISSGFRIILVTIVVSAVMAYLAPIDVEEDEQSEETSSVNACSSESAVIGGKN